MAPMPEAQQERLQLYLDGELDDAARAELERELAGDPALADELGRLRRLRALLGAAPEALAVPMPSAAAFDRLLAGIHAEIDRPAAASPSVAPAKPAVVVPLDRMRRRPTRAFIGGAVALAAAAAVAVVTLTPSHERGGGTGTTVAVTRPGHARAAGTEIVQVEFGKSSGTFWEQSDGNDRVAIVWIDDTMPSEVATP